MLVCTVYAQCCRCVSRSRSRSRPRSRPSPALSVHVHPTSHSLHHHHHHRHLYPQQQPNTITQTQLQVTAHSAQTHVKSHRTASSRSSINALSSCSTLVASLSLFAFGSLSHTLNKSVSPLSLPQLIASHRNTTPTRLRNKVQSSSALVPSSWPSYPVKLVIFVFAFALTTTILKARFESFAHEPSLQ